MTGAVRSAKINSGQVDVYTDISENMSLASTSKSFFVPDIISSNTWKETWDEWNKILSIVDLLFNYDNHTSLIPLLRSYLQY